MSLIFSKRNNAASRVQNTAAGSVIPTVEACSLRVRAFLSVWYCRWRYADVLALIPMVSVHFVFLVLKCGRVGPHLLFYVFLVWQCEPLWLHLLFFHPSGLYRFAFGSPACDSLFAIWTVTLTIFGVFCVGEQMCCCDVWSLCLFEVGLVPRWFGLAPVLFAMSPSLFRLGFVSLCNSRSHRRRWVGGMSFFEVMGNRSIDCEASVGWVMFCGSGWNTTGGHPVIALSGQRARLLHGLRGFSQTALGLARRFLVPWILVPRLNVGCERRRSANG